MDKDKIEALKIIQEAMNIFLKYDGTLSVADATTIFVMNLQNIKSILSFDSDFDKVKNIARFE